MDPVLGKRTVKTTGNCHTLNQGSSCCLQDVLCAAETVINYFIRIRGKKNLQI